MSSRKTFRGSPAISSGLEFAFGVLGLTLGGYWLDGFFDSSPWGVLVGAALGIIGGTYNLIRSAYVHSGAISTQSPEETAESSQEPTNS